MSTATTDDTMVPTIGGDLSWARGRGIGVQHKESRTCPGCGGNLSTVALASLAYVFTRCDREHAADAIDYPHLYEQLWHIDCLRKWPEPSRG